MPSAPAPVRDLSWALISGLLLSLGSGFSPRAVLPAAPRGSRGRVAAAATAASSGEGHADEAPGRPVVAVIGAGAVGCYYGARLHETGQYDVRFHMRGEHLAVSQSRGLNVTSPYGDIFIPPAKVRAYSDPADMGVADWVIVALKSTSLAEALGLVRPLLGNQTRVLAIMNGMVDEDLIDLIEGTGQ